MGVYNYREREERGKHQLLCVRVQQYYLPRIRLSVILFPGICWTGTDGVDDIRREKRRLTCASFEWVL